MPFTTNTFDYHQGEDLEIIIAADGTRVLVNVDGVCAFRAYRVSRLTLRDGRSHETRADDGNATAIAEPSGEGTSRLPSPPLAKRPYAYRYRDKGGLWHVTLDESWARRHAQYDGLYVREASL